MWSSRVPVTRSPPLCDRRGTARFTSNDGLLVHDDNHFIVQGPPPGRTAALALVRHWSIIQIGQETPVALRQWHILSRAFRENLEWAVIVPATTEVSPAVTQLLSEL